MRRIYIIIIAGLVMSGSGFADYRCIWHCTGATDTSQLGYYLVSAGDQNMDGFDDILVTNWGSNEVYLYYGGDPMDTIPDMVFTETCEYCYGGLPLECRDLNGDNHPDIVISADFTWLSLINPETYVYFGGPLLDNQADLVLRPDSLGHSNTYFGKYLSMGDFNGDGYNDLVIAADDYDPIEVIAGKIFIFYGGLNMDSIPDYTVTAEYNNLNTFGDFISCGGDLNNDGYDDIICKGCYSWLRDGVICFFGGSPPDTIHDFNFRNFGPGFNRGLGMFISPDVNDDGYDEIVVGSDPIGSCDAYIFFGGVEVDTFWDVRLTGVGPGQSWCAYAGDVNADGWPDAMAGRWEQGKLNVFFLYPNMPSQKSYDLLIELPYVGGYGMGYAGDVNGDGIDDFMFSENPYYPVPGKVYIYSDTTLSPYVNPKYDYSIADFRLIGNYPNPFNQRSLVSFTLERDRFIKLDVYDVWGRLAANLISGCFKRGMHKISWEAFNMPSGVYFVRLTSERRSDVRKVMLVR